MKRQEDRLTLRRTGSLLAGAMAAAATTTALAQDITIVDYEQRDTPLTGPYDVVIEHDAGLETHTIFRPAELALDEHPVMVWGEGGCAKNGMSFPEFLSEVASHGVVIFADGPPLSTGPGPGAGQGGPRAGGPGGPGGMGNMVNGEALVAAIDWIEAEAANPDSRFYGKVNTSAVAAMGMSCGGLMSYGASNDPRVATVGIWNSGLFEADQELYDGIHGSVIIVTGGESDIAYANGKRDFEDLPADVPVFYGVYPSVGHGGTYSQDNGGAYGTAIVAWLKWQLMDDVSAAGRGFFVGENCGICQDPNWEVDSRSLP